MPHDSPRASLTPTDGAVRVACVSYLNARPLTEDALARLAGGDGVPAIEVVRDVPSAIADRVRQGEAAMGLVPVADLLRGEPALEAWPVGGIACDGPTLTVRLFARKPIEVVRTVAMDTDSHTSVVLSTLLLMRLTGRRPEVMPMAWRQGETTDAGVDALLLIGDKVVTAAPPKWVYPHQLDLGAAWQQWTGLPFVFACWAGRAGEEVGWIAERLDRVRDDNAPRRLELARLLADGHDWPMDLAEAYLTRVLRYEIGPRELAGMRRFAAEAHAAGLVERDEPLVRELASRG